MSAQDTVRDVGQDARPGVELRRVVPRLLAGAAACWLVLFGVGYLLSHPLADSAFERWDGSVDRTLARHRTHTLDLASHWATTAAETTTVIGLGLIAVVVLRVRLARWREGVFLMVALVGEVTIFVLTTLVVDRPRPNVPRLDEAPPTSSFPLGHTTASVTLYFGLALIALAVARQAWVRALFVAIGVLMPILVAASRLYRGMHYPTDVASGALLGLCWLLLVRSQLLPARRAARLAS